ncbi:hypothetical protein PAAG_08636 [Paracoccidioides lutzii Pb01]|uniref:Uncharacterized protein n=1 Tax=Paracoccidioides lutzii (strain ATCC MYA-826 / Pb01) TaxID=502779 RepID=C1HCZ5_PARBA|nr:hypothetical protein PAAG_08636 [Paracoccidioides lutzii Pb01]EEH39367.1 hypothetical protein PAAG_08636 [Paracoccidioides lutzii Pb01]
MAANLISKPCSPPTDEPATGPYRLTPSDTDRVLEFYEVIREPLGAPRVRCTVKTKNGDNKTGICSWMQFQLAPGARESCGRDWDYYIEKYGSMPAAPAPPSVKCYPSEHSQWRYISSRGEIRHIVRFNVTTPGQDDPVHDALVNAVTMEGILAVQCPWQICRTVPDAKSAAGALWDITEGSTKSNMVGLLGLLNLMIVLDSDNSCTAGNEQ